MSRPAWIRNGYIASKTPVREVPCSRVQPAVTASASTAPAAYDVADVRSLRPETSPRRQPTRSTTAANTPTSAMFCFTSRAATVAAPASPAASAARPSRRSWTAVTIAAIPATTNGAASSSPLTSRPPMSGLTHRPRGQRRRPRRGPVTGDGPRDVGATEDHDHGGQAAHQPERDGASEVGGDAEDGDQQRGTVHPVAAVERGATRLPLLAHEEEARLVRLRARGAGTGAGRPPRRRRPPERPGG